MLLSFLPPSRALVPLIWTIKIDVALFAFWPPPLPPCLRLCPTAAASGILLFPLLGAVWLATSPTAFFLPPPPCCLENLFAFFPLREASLKIGTDEPPFGFRMKRLFFFSLCPLFIIGFVCRRSFHAIFRLFLERRVHHSCPLLSAIDLSWPHSTKLFFLWRDHRPSLLFHHACHSRPPGGVFFCSDPFPPYLSKPHVPIYDT